MKKVIKGFLALLLVFLIAGYAYVSVNTLSSGDEYLPSQDIIDKLASLKPVIKGQTTRLGPARKERRNGNTVLYIAGSPYEMGYQQGILLKEEISNGTVPKFSDPLSSSQDFFDSPALLKAIMMIYLEIKIYRPLEENTPLPYLQELKGIADGSGIDYRTIFIANFLSDFNMSMIPGVIKSKAADFESGHSCSSFVASGPATTDGSLLFGRNTDYSGQARWTQNQVIVFYEPAEGKRYVKVSTAGLLKCNSAMNEEGIVVGGHFMGYSDAVPHGASFTVLENEIMRNADSLKEAVDIVKNSQRSGAFGLTIAEGKTGRAMAIEATTKRIGTRPMKNHTLTMTNYALTPELKEVDLLPKYSLTMRNVEGRYLRFQQLIKENFGRIDPTRTAAFMSDHMDVYTGQERATGNTICNQSNVTSVVFQPQNGRFWVAAGGAPMCGNPYSGFSFEAGFQGNPSEIQPDKLNGYQWQNLDRREGLKAFMKAMAVKDEFFGNFDDILANVEKAAGTDVTEPIYTKQQARLLIFGGEYEKAISVLQRSLKTAVIANEKALAHLHLGQAYDLSGKRDLAEAHYQKVIDLNQAAGDDHSSRLNFFVSAFAETGLKEPFTQKQLNDILIMSERMD